ncbi:hypothetical protein ASE27_10115 [Oerskovia sp. Root918]|uniref:hypothetical protein n=1 Tax=Oerskovia sp. Root918 TaxID=1736607 RepID=UPI0006F555D2|nr:hypothetical protein [Oerskovia sp. Root918]KRD36801.1 hypothetical protein ASE27_10115 [Oerskovia sp. Root918]
MRVESLDLDAEIAGTTQGDRLEVHAWRGGVLVAQDLDVSDWSLAHDADRQVQGQATITVGDPDGTLAPWGMSDPLGPGGSRLQITWVSGLSGSRVPLGWWRIRRPDPQETWQAYNSSGTLMRVAGGGSVTVQADEETSTAVMSRLDAEVVTAPTCVAEVRRLLQDVCPVVALEGVIDGPVPGSLVYGDGRLDAVEDLLATINATYRMGPDGAMEIVPVAGIGPVWTLAGGEDGVLVQTVRSLSDDGVYNAVISTGQTPEGSPLVGRAVIASGPLAWGGPFGKVPLYHRSIATTQLGVQADAQSTLDARVASGEVDLAVTCLTHPALQLNDRVIVIAATTAGDQALEGRVVGMRMTSATSDAGTTPSKTMSLRVRVSVQTLESIAARVRRG